MVNVPVARRDGALENPRIRQAVAAAEQALAGQGRVLVRPSGTEPLIRIMVEGREHDQLHHIAADLEEVIQAEMA